MISNDEYSKLLDQQFENKTNISANKIISGTILKINDMLLLSNFKKSKEDNLLKHSLLNEIKYLKSYL